MGATLGTCLNHLEKEKSWQVALYKKFGRKTQERSEIVTQAPQTAPHRALQSLSLWKHILIVQGYGVQPSCLLLLLFLLLRHCHWLTLVPAAEPLSWKSEVGTQSVSPMPYWLLREPLPLSDSSWSDVVGSTALCDALRPLPFLHLGASRSFRSLLSNCCITKQSNGWDVLYIQQSQLSFYPKYVYIVFKSLWMRKC